MRLGDLLTNLAEPPAYVDCDADTAVGGLAVDSRRVARGDAFLALRGATHDAHAYLREVHEAGAACVIIERGAVTDPRGPHVWIGDTAQAYPELAAAAFGRPGERLQLAAITGTNGKTTTAHLVSALLGSAGRLHARLGTTGNWLVDREAPATLTTPFPLEMQQLLATAAGAGATHGVMEASSHALAQGRLRPLQFRAIGFTSFSQDHLDFHPDMETYLAAKCLLARAHVAPDGVAVAAVDDHEAALRFLAAVPRARRWRASRGRVAGAEILARDVRFGRDRTEATVDTPAGTMTLNSPLIATYNLDNLLVAIGIGIGLEVPLATIETAVRDARGAPGRLERVELEGSGGPLVVVDYAHTPDAVARSIAAVRTICGGALWVVLGCGGDRDPKKRPHMGAIAAAGADHFIATSDNPRTEDPDAIVDAMLAGVDGSDHAKTARKLDRAAAIAFAIERARPEDLVLVAGKGHEDYQVLGSTRIHFDDREHARAALSRRA